MGVTRLHADKGAFSVKERAEKEGDVLDDLSQFVLHDLEGNKGC
jgi:hypothetical protein